MTSYINFIFILLSFLSKRFRMTTKCQHNQEGMKLDHKRSWVLSHWRHSLLNYVSLVPASAFIGNVASFVLFRITVLCSQVNSADMFKLLRPFQATVWITALATFTSLIFCHSFLEFLEMGSQERKKKNCLQVWEASTWNIVQLWLHQCKFLNTPKEL